MTRRQLARHLSADLIQQGHHFVQGSTVWRTFKGDWGALPGTTPVPPETLFYAVHAWRPTAALNTVFSVENYLATLEQQHVGKRTRIDQRSLRLQR